MKSFEIENRSYSAGRSLIIAELSANHNGSFETALQLVDAAAAAGADAVKVQTFTADSMTLNSELDPFVVRGTIWDGRKLHDLYAEAAMPWDWQPKLLNRCKELGLHFFSSPFDTHSADFLADMNVPCYKIASFELIDIPLIKHVASKGKPIIMSTGMATLDEIAESVRVVKRSGVPLALLKCTSSYPAEPETMNLRTIPNLRETFGTPAGLSDHTLGAAVPVAAVALGAAVIEKHFTLSRDDPGPDSSFSMEPSEFKAMVDSVRVAEQAIGRVDYTPTERESSNRKFRRSVFAVEDIPAGTKFSTNNVKCIRPAGGLLPKYYEAILGSVAKSDITRGTALEWRHVV